MLYYLSQLKDVFSPLRLFQYITVRAFCAAATAFLLCLLFGPALIRFLTRMKLSQGFRQTDAPALAAFHAGKKNTPIMGGLLIIFAVTAAVLLWTPLNNGFIWLALSTMLYMGALGCADDYQKIRNPKSRGIRARTKMLLQILWATLVVGALWCWPVTARTVHELMVPFFKEPLIYNLGIVGSILFVYLVLVGCANAVNLTDGLDGLAAGCSGAVAVAYLVMSYAAGNFVIARYLHIPYLPGTGELAVFCGAIFGASLGFLWFNCYPARVFMGDTGSLALGGALAMVAILIKQELALVIVGGVFVLEAGSVLLQVASFKLTGRRIFKCAPLHHHFEMLEKEKAQREGRAVGVIETTIVMRLWILSILFALCGVATLKIR